MINKEEINAKDRRFMRSFNLQRKIKKTEKKSNFRSLFFTLFCIATSMYSEKSRLKNQTCSSSQLLNVICIAETTLTPAVSDADEQLIPGYQGIQ